MLTLCSTFKRPNLRDSRPRMPSPNLASDLSPFSKMVYDRSSFMVRYPTPDTPKPAVAGGQTASTTPKLQPSVVQNAATPRPANSILALNQQSHAQNASRIEISIPTVRTGAAGPALARSPSSPRTPSLPSARAQMRTPQKSRAAVTIDLSNPPTHFNADEYARVEECAEAPESLSARKRRNEYKYSEEIYGGLDKRQQVDTALRDLQRCCHDIFAAEINLGLHSAAIPLIALTSDQEPSLTVGALQRLYPLIQKAISLGCFALVPVGDLLHLQQLCDRAVRQAASLDLRIDENWGESDVGSWVLQLPDVDAGLKAARTALNIMCGGREDKQLYSEDAILGAVDLFKKVMDSIVVPVAELRNARPSDALFKQLSGHRKTITTVFTSCQRLFAVMTDLTSKVELSGTVINTLEFAASHLMFVENAHTERDSVLGVQRFDGLRLVAMDMLCQIFLINPQQRAGIFDEILTSLEKLPVGKQSARQFKLVDGRSIQPVSALIMRLVQASAGKVSATKLKSRTELPSVEGTLDSEEEEVDDGRHADAAGVKNLPTITSEDRGAVQHGTAIQELHNLVAPLSETATRNATYVVNFIIKRAQKSTKSGDTPYRNLLDLFVEDFTTCLESPDWPAAERLLQLFMAIMINLVENEQQSAPTKNMALEVLGVLGSAVSKLRSQVRKSANSIDIADPDELGIFLRELAESALGGKSRSDTMLAWTGPYRAALEYLERRCSEDPHLSSAISYMMMDWASKIHSAYEEGDDGDEERDQELGRLAYRLRMMVENRRWLSTEYSFTAVPPIQAKLSHSIILVRSRLCESFPRILYILLKSMSSDQATVRSKSLKSINQVMETDPSILDGESIVVEQIVQCSSDRSTQVRDSALGLIGKAISLRPALEKKTLPTIIDRVKDSGVGVRKRAIKLAKDIYLRSISKVVRANIASAMLQRVHDPDEGVRELARQIIEEIWIFPFFQGEGTAEYKTSLDDHVALMVQTVRSGNAAPILGKVLQAILSPDSKTAKANFEVCKRLVASIFDLVGKPDPDDASLSSDRHALQLLQVFAKADPRLFTFEQIRLLKPHLANLNIREDVAVSRAVVSIYYHVLPQLSSVHDQFLSEVRLSLIPVLSSAAKPLLNDAFACLWVICELQNCRYVILKLISSTLQALQKFAKAVIQFGPLDTKKGRLFERYTMILGAAGRFCDFTGDAGYFRADFPTWEGDSVSKLMIDMLIGFTNTDQCQQVRKATLDAVGLICQSSPRNYVAPNVYTVFQTVFDEQNRDLEHTIMRPLGEFLTTEEMRSGTAAKDAKVEKAAGIETPKKRELTVMGGTNHDDVASATTQRFLKPLTRIALSSLDEHAYLATEILGTINRQGLVHPKETGITMITLETSPVSAISELAFREHKALHGKHESVLEREYVKAIQSVFFYQRDIAKDARGATTNPFSSKLHLLMEILKDSKSRNRQRFLEKMCSQVDFDPSKLDVSEDMPAHVEFSRFVIENLAFFEYITVGEVQAAVSFMEKIVHRTGATVAHAIESELFQVRMDVDQSSSQQVPAKVEVSDEPFATDVNRSRLRQLTAGSMILLCLWEARTHVRRLYNHRREKGKAAGKDLSRAPVKSPAVSGDKFWEDSSSIMSALSSEEQMLRQCKTFVELMNVDKELKVVDDDDEMADAGEEPTTPSGDDDDDPSADRGRKRKAAGTPGSRKKRARSSSQPRKRGRPK